MSSSRRLSLILGGVLAAAAIIAPAAAQDDPAAQFQGRYVELRAAIQAGDAAKVASVLAPEYRLSDIQGEEHDAASMTERMTRAGEDGAEHKMELLVRSSDSWARRGGTWLLVRSEQKELTVKRDGEVFLHQAK